MHWWVFITLVRILLKDPKPLSEQKCGFYDPPLPMEKKNSRKVEKPVRLSFPLSHAKPLAYAETTSGEQYPFYTARIPFDNSNCHRYVISQAETRYDVLLVALARIPSFSFIVY